MPGSKSTSKIKFAFFCLSLLLIWYLGRFVNIDEVALRGYFARLPLIPAASLFVLSYVIITFFVWFSKDVFKIISAIVFGAYLSTLLIWIAESINAAILFNLSRKLGRDFVGNSLKGGYRGLDEKMGELGFSWIFLLRLVPLLPFRFLDLAAGLTNISFGRYILCALLGSPLRIFWIQVFLVGTGKRLFYSPASAAAYLAENQWLYAFSMAYLLLIVVVAMKIKRLTSQGRQKKE
jgi:uncharacterized membrane protein YdjX (TVP38/TMEM64 family)